MNRRGFVAILFTTAVAASVLPATAATAGPSGGRKVTVIATGLNNPRGIIAGPHGTLLVAEAGKGGTGKCKAGPEGEVCLGRTGSVTKLWKDSKKWKSKRIVTKLPSLAAPGGDFAIGPHDLAFGAKRLLGTIGLEGSPRVRTALGKDARRLGHLVDYRREGPAKVCDLAGFEARRNPDYKDMGSEVDSNPYGLLGTKRGAVVADAGGNTLLSVDKHGKVKVLAVFHARQVPGPGGGPLWMQTVPTSVARGPDGAYYVGELTGFPFPTGGAKVWRVKPGHKPKVYAKGFTNIVDVGFDRKGRLMVLEITKYGLTSGNPTGALIRLDGKNKRTELAPGKLTMPGGFVVGKDRAVYVTNKSVSAGGGEVLRIRT